MASEPVGFIYQERGGYLARCNVARCGWTLQRNDKAEAVRDMRGHAVLVHPKPIPVYLEEARDA